MKKANQFLKKAQLLSKVGSVLNNTAVPMQFRIEGLGIKLLISENRWDTGEEKSNMFDRM